jgi:hypothetical protein
MIPEAKNAAVARALGEAFGVTEFEDIRMLTAGLTSALVFRIIVRRCPYLLPAVQCGRDPDEFAVWAIHGGAESAHNAVGRTASVLREREKFICITEESF